MVTTIVQSYFKIDRLVTGNDTAVRSLTETFFNRAEELLRNRTSLDFVYELNTTTWRQRLDTNLHVTVLTATSGLLDVLTFGFSVLLNRFFIGNLRTTDVSFHVKLTLHTVGEHVEVKLTHTRDNRLTSFSVSRYPEGRIFFSQTAKRHTHLLLVSLRLRFDAHRDNRLREDDTLKDNRIFSNTERVTGGGRLHTDERADITGVNLFNFFTLVRVHTQDTADALGLVLRRVQNITAALEHTRVHTEIGQRTDERVSGDFECKRGKRLIIGGLARDRSTSLIRSLHTTDIHRRRQVINNRVEHELHTLVLERSTGKHRNNLHRERRLTERLL